MSLRKDWSLISAVPHCGAGSPAMPSARGNIEPGSSLAIPTSPIKPVRSSIFTSAFGKAPPLGSDDYVISADEKSSIQARRRKQQTLPPAPSRPTRVEHEYFREGAWTYLAAWDVHRAKVFGRCEVKSGIAPVDRLVSEVMGQEPYKSARRVFWIMDNCSAHRGQKAAQRLREKWPRAILIHTPVHASWLNQVEIYFSIVQRKVLTPNDFSSLAELEQRLLAFQCHYQGSASPFKWTFTRRDLHTLLAKIEDQRLAPAA
jgi:DDE superfamily endonuclease